MDNTEEVADWLRAIGMSNYIPVFRAQAVTGDTLLSLTSVELRKTLGVTKLGDRRVLLEHIEYLEKALSADAKATIPEDGRILTHLSNERWFLLWVRVCLTVQTFAVGSIRLVNIQTSENQEEVRRLAIVTSAIGLFAVFYATGKYYRNNQLIEDPGPNHLPGKFFLMPPTIFLIIGVVTTLFVRVADSTEEAAVLALLLVLLWQVRM